MKLFDDYKATYPAQADQLYRMQHRQLPDGWDKEIPVFPPDPKGVAGRDASGKVLNAIAKHVPWLIGGAADLAPSTKTRLTFEGAGDFAAESYAGRNFHFGVREHAMGSILNGLALSKLRPYGSGFLIFSDYSRPTFRLAAIMEIPVTYIFTHDSIGVGEDGPTHQPIEHLTALRAIPNLVTIRPFDGVETALAWAWAARRRGGPTIFALSRQTLPALDRRAGFDPADVARGAYAVRDPGAATRVVLVATGSEVGLACDAAEKLHGEGIPARVVSMPCVELFLAQPPERRRRLVPEDGTPVVAVEAARGESLRRFVGPRGLVYGIDRFGASAPLADLARFFGYTPDQLATRVVEHLHALGAAEPGSRKP